MSRRSSSGRRGFGDHPGNVAIVESPDPATNLLYDLELFLVSGHKASRFVDSKGCSGRSLRVFTI